MLGISLESLVFPAKSELSCVAILLAIHCILSRSPKISPRMELRGAAGLVDCFVCKC